MEKKSLVITLELMISKFNALRTAGFMKTVPSVYNLSMNTIYTICTQVAEGTVFKKHTVSDL